MRDALLEYVKTLSPWAQKAQAHAVKAIESGEINLVEHASRLGIWVNSPDGRFFLDLSDTEVALSHADKATYHDSDNPDDWGWLWAESEPDPVQVNVDFHSGRVRNWSEVCKHFKKCDDNVKLYEVQLKEFAVKTYTRKNGQVVQAHRRHRDSVHKFVGIGQTLKHGVAPKGSDEEPSTSKEWHIYQFPPRDVGGKTLAGQTQLVHPETGDIAPAGTTVTPPEDYKGEKLTGFVQTKGQANPIYNTDTRWREKLTDLESMIKAEVALSSRVRNDLANKEWTKEKRCALVVMLLNRHVFRVGGEGTKSKKKGDPNASYEDTFGATTLTKEHIVPEGDRVWFNFVGKAGVDWKKVDSDPLVVQMVSELVDSVDDGDKVFGVSDDDVRDYLRPYGFNPHKFRTYWASYLFFKTARDIISDQGVADTKKQRDSVKKRALEVAAEKLNDTIGAVEKNYVLPQLLEQLLGTGKVDDTFGLHEYHLAEQWFGFWLPDEQLFHSWVDSVNQQFSTQLSESVLLGPWPELQAGDHWVTLKPHGPDSEDYRRVIIREHPDGSAHVVWAGDKGLEHLRLTKTGSKEQIDQAEARRNNSRSLTPEEKQAQDQKREERKNAVADEKSAYGQSLLSAIGAPNLDADELIRALDSKKLRSDLPGEPKTPEQVAEERRRAEERARMILDGQLPEASSAPDPLQGVTPQRATVEASMADILGELPHTLSGVSPELKEAWDQARANPSAVAQIAALRAKHQERIKEINKDLNAGPRGNLRVVDRMAFYSEPGDNERALLNAASERARYQMNSRFWHLNSGGKVRGEDGQDKDEPGLGNGAREFFYQGGTDALTTISDKFASGKQIHVGMLQELGPEVMAAALAADIINRGSTAKDSAEKRIRMDIAKNAAPTVAESLAIAEDADRERDQIRQEFGMQMLTDVARANALKNQTVRKQKALARAAGSLESAATVADFLRTGVGEGITIPAGDKLDAIRDRLDSLGLTDGDGYEMRYAGDNVGLFVAAADLPRLLQASDRQYASDEEVQQIKSHKANTPDFQIPGLNPDYKLKPQQQSAIRMFEKQGKVYGNLSVGIGKTLTFGAAAARMFARGEAKSGLYIVPTNLLAGTQKELQKLFPGMSIEVAHPDLNPNIKSKEDRRSMYTSKDRAQITLIGQDTVRMDADHLKAACESSEAPDFIFGDEVHSMFTPGENDEPGKQSQRSRALKAIRANKMLVMTGTPIRRSSVEVYKVLDWLHPGRYGSAASWHLRYGKIGQGVSAYSNAVNEAFQHEIDDSTITESDKPNTELIKETRRIPLHPQQVEAYRGEQRRYDEAILNPRADRRKLSAAKVNRQREAIFTGDRNNNAMISELHGIAETHGEGTRGIIHCTSLKAVRAVASSFAPGEVLTYTGDDAVRRRDSIISAVNDGTLITGGRAQSLDTGDTGVVMSLGDKQSKIRLDDGTEKSVPTETLQSKVRMLAGTSTAVGVVSTGLNLQKGSDWTVHFQLPDSAATYKQRDARNYRTGQLKDVHSYTLIPETPATREHWQRIQEQDRLLAAFDDPTDFDENELFTSEDNPQTEDVNLNEVSLGEHRSLHPEQKGQGSAHKGGRYQSRSRLGVPEEHEPAMMPVRVFHGMSMSAKENIERKNKTDTEIASVLSEDPKNVEALGRYCDLFPLGNNLSMVEFCQDMRGAWAESSQDFRSLCMMKAIQDEFFVDGSTGHISDWDSPETNETWKASNHLFKSYVREVYRRTQEELKDHDKDYVVVYRGMQFDKKPPWWKPKGKTRVDDRSGLEYDEAQAVSFGLQPLSSFAFNRNVAVLFANNGPNGEGDKKYQCLLKVRVPKEDVWSTFSSGIGSESESEAIIFGGKYRGLAAVHDFDVGITNLSETEKFIGNLDETDADWIKSAKEDDGQRQSVREKSGVEPSDSVASTTE